MSGSLSMDLIALNELAVKLEKLKLKSSFYVDTIDPSTLNFVYLHFLMV